MQAITVEINNNDGMRALQDLQKKHFIKIVDTIDLRSPSLPGKILGLQEFRNWINAAEQAPSLSLKEAKAKWANKRKQLQKIAK